jgi:hypothetical protein
MQFFGGVAFASSDTPAADADNDAISHSALFPISCYLIVGFFASGSGCAQDVGAHGQTLIQTVER